MLTRGGWKPLARRAAFTAGAYLVAAIVIVLTFFVLKGRVAPGVLQGLLGYFFIASTTAGIEPGTVKAAALAGAPERADVRAVMTASAVKGLIAAPVVAWVWRFADAGIGLDALAWTAGLCIAGFAASDLRVMFDLEGRHAAAIWIKQGALAAGLALVAFMTGLGAPLALGIGVSTLARLAFAGAIATFAITRHDRTTPTVPLPRAVGRLLADRRWMALAGASVVAAASGGADRVFGLRYLSAEAWAGYYLTYEVFSKFWFIPYLLGPIVFARRVAEGANGVFPREAERLTIAAGAVFVAAVAAVVLLAPADLVRSLRLPIGPPTLAFAAAIAISSFTQLRVLRLQGAGAARAAFAAMSLGAILSFGLFLAGARIYGATGLMLAWLTKSLLELIFITVAGRLARQVA